jgi:hypothetical protein
MRHAFGIIEMLGRGLSTLQILNNFQSAISHFLFNPYPPIIMLEHQPINEVLSTLLVSKCSISSLRRLLQLRKGSRYLFL